ncbi:MAG: DUF4384 domain-containing protein [Cytophagales bacterium]|nr:DUF4384 domain-containing protein [Cytophagales bacterium]MDW8384835.1 DUF4384 domain-containing protein [Flammeovirgaceae bacterium]
MKQIHNFIAFMLFLIGQNYAQRDEKPNWIDYRERLANYPESQYLIGYSAQVIPKGEDLHQFLDKQKAAARTELSQSVQVNIKSISMMNIENLDAKTHEYFQNISSAYTNVDIAGLKTETYYDEKKGIAYAFCYAKKMQVRESTYAKLSNYLSAMQQKIATAQNFAQKGQKQLALKTYMEIYPLYAEIENLHTLLIALGARNNDLGIEQYQAEKEKVRSEIEMLAQSEMEDLEDAAFFIANSLKLQKENGLQGTIRLLPLTYADSEIASHFSRRFQTELENKLVTVGGFRVSSQAIPSSGTYKEEYTLTGTYRDENNSLKIKVVLRESQSKQAIAAAEARIPLSYLAQNKIEFKPENFDEIYNQAKEFQKGQISGGGLQVQIWTNKGESNLIFVKGERMKLYVKANRECFLRVIYHLADGEKVLLLDNYYVSPENVNKVYELPYEFECSEPFGVETLQLNAQTQAFEPLQTETIYGYKFIREDFKNTLVKTRGFKPVQETAATTERRLRITTMEY